MKRPLVQVTLLYVLGILLARWVVPLPWLFLLAAILLTVACLWSRARPWLLGLLLILTGWISLAQRTAIVSPNDLRTVLGNAPVIATVRGVLCVTPQQHHHLRQDKETETTTAQIDVSAFELNRESWQPGDGRIVVMTKGALPESFFQGQTVEINGVIAIPDAALAPGLFDYRAYLANLGIYHELKAEDPAAWKLISSPARPPLADRFGAWARKTLAYGLPNQDKTLELEWALTLGWKAVLTEDVTEPFIRAATYHIFAVDGLRIAIVSGILLMVFRTARLPRAWCVLPVAVLVLFYAAMTGWPASAVRAIVMLGVVYLGWLLRRPSDLYNSLFAAAFVILAFEPRQLFQAGFQLSFFVVLCILLIHPFFDRLAQRLLKTNPLRPQAPRTGWRGFLHSLKHHAVQLCVASVAAWLGSIPLVAYYFHLFTPASGPANIFAVPLCMLVLIANLCSLLFGAWFPFASELFNHAGWFLMNCIDTISQWFAHWPAAYFYLPAPGLFTLVLYYLILLTTLTGWLFQGKLKAWKITGLSLLAAVWCVRWLGHGPETAFTILPLKGGHSVFLQTNAGHDSWLVDCGSESSVDGELKPYLRAHGINRLPNLILTHGDANYTGGAGKFAELFQPENIYTSAAQSRSPSYRVFQQSKTNDPAWKNPLTAGDQIGPWSVLHPHATDHLTKAEDNAIVLRGTVQGTRLLLGGLGQLGQRELAAQTNDLSADILVTGPLTIGDPLSETLLDAIKPRVIIIADAKDPTPRRISPAFKERLSLWNIPVIYTRTADAVTLTLTPGKWELTTMEGTHLSGSAGTAKP